MRKTFARLSIDVWWFEVIFGVVWLGWLGSAVWRAYNDYNQPQPRVVEEDKPARWTWVQGWIVGLGTAFIALITLSRLSGSNDTAFLTGWIWTAGTVAVFGWAVSALLAFAILAWRLGLFVRARWRAGRRT